MNIVKVVESYSGFVAVIIRLLLLLLDAAGWCEFCYHEGQFSVNI